jgi:hypothetical protein
VFIVCPFDGVDDDVMNALFGVEAKLFLEDG